jgi:hypothetical protein
MGDKPNSAESMKRLTERVIKADLASRFNLRTSLNARNTTRSILTSGLFIWAAWVY